MKKIFTILCLQLLVIYVWAQAPTIANFSPANGPAGTVVFMAGTNFNATPASNFVYFGATRATVIGGTTTSLTVMVPVGATYKPISVLNTANGLSGYSATPFITTFSPVKGAILSNDFTSAVDVPSGAQARSVAIADLDGDGKADIAVMNRLSSNVSIFRNISASGSLTPASFAPQVDFSVPGAPVSLAVGDLDGDGRPDLALAIGGGTTVAVLRNGSSPGTINGSSFGGPVSFTTGGQPQYIAISDLDGDGKSDIVCANLTTTSISIFRNISSPGSLTVASFAAKVDFTTGVQPRAVAIGDLDGDGKPEIAVANVSSNTVSILQNTSSIGSITISSFAGKVDFATAGGTASVAIGDLDGDGKPDIATSNENGNNISVLRNTFSGGSITPASFAGKVDFPAGASPQGIVFGDLDGDGKIEIVVANLNSNTLSVFRNTATSGIITNSSFMANVDFATGSSPWIIAIGDLDGDGKSDLAVTNGLSNSISILRNNPIFPPIVTNSAASVVSTSGATLNGLVNDNGNATTTTFTYGTSPTLVGGTTASSTTGASIAANTGNTATAYTITGLTAGTTYYFRANATNGGGTTSGTPILSFTTLTPPGNALNFDGVNDQVTVTNTGQMNFGTGLEFTIEAWYKTSSVTAGTIFTSGNNGSNGINIQILANGRILFTVAGVGHNPLKITNDGKWHHVAALRRSGVLEFYLDGILLGLSNFSPQNVTTVSNFKIGINGSGTEPFNGSIDDIRIYNIALTASQLQADRATSTSVLPGNRVLDYSFDSGIGGSNNAGITTLADNVSVANNGTLSGFALTGNTSNWVSSYGEVVPVANTSTSITSSSFTASWTAPATGIADSYQLDVSSDTNFASFLSGYNSLSLSGLSQAVTGLNPSSVYYYRVRAVRNNPADVGGNSLQITTITATPSTNADLSAVTTTAGAISPSFAAPTTTYTANVSNATTAITITPTVADAAATQQVRVNGGGYTTVVSGNASGNLALNVGANTVDVLVTAESGGTKTYTITVYRSTPPPGNALHFDGTNDRVVVPNAGQFTFGTGDFTLEAYINTTSSQGTIMSTSSSNPSAGILVYIVSGTVRINLEGSTFNTGLGLSDGFWHHIAVTRSSGSVNVYFDGVVKSTISLASNITPNGPFAIGYTNTWPYFNGKIDDVRVYNVPRTLAEIQSDLKSQIPAAGGLIAAFNFDQGVSNGSNAGITTLNDFSSNANNGTLENFALSGTTSNFTGSMSLVIPTATSATSGNNSSFTANWTASQVGIADSYRLDVSLSSNFTTILPNYNNITVNGLSQVVTNLPQSTIYYYRVRAFTTADGSGPNSNVISAATTALTPPGNSLTFDGSDDYLTVVQSPQIIGLGAGSFTAEAWVKPGNMADLSIFRKTGDYNFLVLNGKLYAEVWTTTNNASTYKLIVGTQLIPAGKWAHVALVKTGSSYAFYIDGELDASTVTPGNISTVENLQIGRSAAYGNPFFGAMDELRLWNVARTQSEIRTGRTSTVSSSATGLVFYYDFDQGTAGGTNTGLTTVYDRSLSAANGTLQNFALTGTTSNFTASYALVVPTATAATAVAPTSFTANWTAPANGVADSYRFDLSTSATFATFVAGNNDRTVNTTSLMITGLTPGTQYYYRVRAYNNAQAVSGGASSIITISTPATLTPPGNALVFDGTNDQVSVTNRPVSFNSTPFTIETWIKTTGNSMGILNHGNGNTTWESGEKSFYIDANGTPGFVGFANNYITTNVPVNDGFWHHVSITYNGTGGSGKIYVDGFDRTITSSFTGGPADIGRFYLGRPDFSVGPNYFNGSLDEIRVFNTERTPLQVDADMRNSIAANTAGLVYSFDLNQGKNAGDNTAIVQIRNNTSAADPGTLNGFSLTNGNTTSNFVGAQNYLMPPPTAPLTSAQQSTQFSASWTAPVSETASGYFIDVATDAAFSTILPTHNNEYVGNVLTFNITGLNAGTQYYFRVRAYNTYLGNSVNTATQTATTQTSVVSINRTTAQLTNASTISFTVTFAQAVTGLSSGNFSSTETGTVTNTSFISLTGSGTTYTVTLGTGTGDGTFALNLANSTGISPGISTALPFAGQSYTIDKTAPATPANLSAVSGDTQNVISWDANIESDLNKYNLYFGTTNNPTTLLSAITAGTTMYTHIGITNGTPYYYRIEAVDNATNVSTQSAVVSQTPRANQAITFASTDSKVYGTADYNPGATSATSGTNAITYMSSNTSVATIVSGNIHIVGVGTSTITASQGGSAAYNAAPDVTQTLTVTAKPVTVTADAKSKVYGGADPALTYTFSPVLVAGDSFSGALSRTPGENVGSYAINQNTLALSSNYTLSYVSADITITAKPVTVTADAKTKVYGSADPAFTYIVSPALVSGDSFSGTLSRTGGEDVGAYAINQNTLALSSNYLLTYASANLAITAKPVTVTADAKTKVYGAADPALTYTFSPALVAGDSFSGALSRTGGENVGAYAINQNTLALSSNYSLSYVSANLTITAKPVTVTADAKSKVYGSADPALTYTFSPALIAGDSFTGSLSRTGGENVSTYAINKNTLALSSNYTLSYVSANLTITAKPVTVTADAKTKVYGAADPALTYTFSPALVTGDSFTGSLSRTGGENAGNYTINQGTLSLSVNYTLSYVPANLTITAKPVTVTADAKTKVYGSADPALTYTVSPALVAGDSFSGALSRTAGENTGSYAINKNTLALSSNYTLTYVSANLTITSKALTITADNKSRQQGVANPPLTASYSGFVNGETNAVLTTQPSLSTTATIASPQGNYPITPSGAAAQNYSIAYVNGTLSVTPGNVTSVSLAASALYENRPAGTLAGTLSSTSDDPNATFTYTLVSGTGSTDNSSFSISGSQVLTTAPLNFENKPSYSIRVRSTTQFGLSLEQVFTINLLNVNEVPTISQVAEQITCYSANAQNIALTGISAGPDAGQSTALSFTNSNAGIFNSFSITNGTGGAGVISYTMKPGTSGIATITVTVQDDGGTANGGTDQTSMTFTLTVNALPVVNISSDKGSNDLSKGDVAILTATGGSSYTWATAAGIMGSQTSASLTVKPLVTTTYTVTATNASGCSTSQSFTVNVLEDFKTIDAANIISPNGDGVNDFWVIKNIELYPNNEVKVFDRAGRIVFSKKGYLNTWDATVNGSPLAEGTYYYAVDFGAGKMIQKGYITLIRAQ